MRASEQDVSGPGGFTLVGGTNVADVTLQFQSCTHRLHAGDQDAYELLVRTHAPRLLSVARRLLRHEEDARDAVQEGFLLAFRSLSRFEARSTVATWLYRIVVNAALMKLRSRQRKPETSIEDLLPVFDADGQHAAEIDEWRRPGLDRLLRDEVRSQVRRAINALPESSRTVILLRDIEECSTEEVAAQLGITPNAVKIRLHRGRLALRTLLNPVFRRI